MYIKIEDGGHFIPFDQNICRSKQDMKNRKRVLCVVLKVLSSDKIKNILPFAFYTRADEFRFIRKFVRFHFFHTEIRAFQCKRNLRSFMRRDATFVGIGIELINSQLQI